jgi:hypothetical protein
MIASFFALGSSVAHWRLALALTLPLAFVPLAVLVHLIHSAPSRLWLTTPDDVRLSKWGLVYAAIAVIVANVAVFAAARSPQSQPAAAWQQLEEVRKLKLPRVNVRLESASAESAALARYYLAGSRIDFIDPEAGLAPATLEAISPKAPLFVQGAGCAEAGHEDVVAVGELGCLLMTPPSVMLDKGYPLGSRVLFLASDGLTARYGRGRLSSRDGVALRITADPAKVRLQGDLHVNVLLDALIAEGAAPRRLQVVWANGDSSEMDLQTREWISVPVRGADWTGNRLWSVPLRFRVLDGRAIVFEQLSVTEQPAGRALQRPDGQKG